MRPDLHLSERLLVGAAEDGDPRGGPVAREQQVIGFVDQHAGDARQAGQRAQKRTLLAVEDVDAVGTCMSDVHPPRGPVGVRMVEARLRAGRDRNEADAFEAHASAPCATSFWHQA
jgi:hypothetical protein